MVSFGIDTGMGAMLYEGLDRSVLEALSPELYGQLRASYLAAVFANQDQLDALQDVLSQSADLQSPVCLIKGIWLSRQYYPLPQLRLMRDMDILLAEEDVLPFESLLLRQAYRQVSEYSAAYYQNHHHTMPFYHEKRRVWIEVHTQLFREGGWRSKIPAFSRQNIQQEMRYATIDGVKVCHLSAELQLVYIAAHWLVGFKPEGGLFALCDAVFLLRREKSFDWDKLLAWTSRSKQLAQPVFLLLSSLQQYRLWSMDKTNIRRLQSHCGRLFGFRRAVFNVLLYRFYLQPGPYGRLLNDFSLGIIWNELCRPSPFPYVLRVAWYIVFPQSRKERFSLGWHWQRLKKIFSFN